MCHSLSLDWNSFCLLEALLADALTQTDHNCFFLYNRGLLFDSWNMTNRWQRKENRTDFTLHTAIHTFFFFFLFSYYMSPVPTRPEPPPPTSQWFSQLAAHIRTSSLPANLPVHPTKSICSDLWCRAAPQCHLTAGELLDQHTFLFGCLADGCLSHTHARTHTVPSPLQSAHYQYARHFIVHNKELRLAVVNAYIVWWISYLDPILYICQIRVRLFVTAERSNTIIHFTIKLLMK